MSTSIEVAKWLFEILRIGHGSREKASWNKDMWKLAGETKIMKETQSYRK